MRAATIWAVKISDNVATDENEPEVLFVGLHHAREHLTVEMTLYLLNELVSQYMAPTRRITNIVNTPRDLHRLRPQPRRRRVRHRHRLLPLVAQEPPAQRRLGQCRHRPEPQLWLPLGLLRRVERQHRPAKPIAAPSAFSAPETQRVRDFINSRVIGGVQQIKASITFHTYGELVLWPYGYTYTDVPSDMTQDDHDVFVAMGTGHGRRPTATRRSRPATCTSPTAPTTTGPMASTGSSPTPSRCTRSSSNPRLLPARRGDRRADHPQPRGGAATVWSRPIAYYRAIGKQAQYCGTPTPTPTPEAPTATPRGARPATPRPPTNTPGPDAGPALPPAHTITPVPPTATPPPGGNAAQQRRLRERRDALDPVFQRRRRRDRHHPPAHRRLPAPTSAATPTAPASMPLPDRHLSRPTLNCSYYW